VADGAEVDLAVRYGWEIAVEERLLFNKSKVMDTWARRLLELRERAAQAYQRGELCETQGKLLVNALRAIMLHTVGAFGRVQRPERRYFHQQDTHLIDARRCIGAPYRLPNGMWVVEYTPAPLPADEQRFLHPEWPAAIYAITRCRLLYYRTQEAGALTIPRPELLAMRTDALYVSSRQPWKGTQPGQFREKGAITHRVAAPHTETELLRLAEKLEGLEDGSS
jgi:hypothetical protein